MMGIKFMKNFLEKDFNKRKKAVSPLIATILLIVVVTSIIVIVLFWGKGFTDDSLNLTLQILKEDESLIGFIQSSQITTQPNTFQIKNLSNKLITINKYKIVYPIGNEYNLLNRTFTLKEPLNIFANNFNHLPLICVPDKDFVLNIITEDNTYVSVKINNARGYSLDSCKTNLAGEGNESNPFKIYNIFQLNDIRNYLDIENIYFSLENNIDFDLIILSDFNYINGFENYDLNGWDPIGGGWQWSEEDKFKGNFNGNNNFIKNLYIYRPNEDHVGLFGSVKYSEIKNLILEDVNINGSDVVGCLSGLYLNGSVSKVGCKGNIFGKRSLGGLVGGVLFSDFTEVYSSGNIYNTSVSGDAISGGLIGYFDFSTILNSYSTSNVYSFVTGEIGGFIGFFAEEGTGTIINSYSVGVVDVDNLISGGVHGFIGYSGNEEVFNSYWDIETSQHSTDHGIPGIIGKNTIEMKKKNTFNDWDFSNIWNIKEGITYPYLKNTIQINLPQ